MYDQTKEMVIASYMTPSANYYNAYGDGISYFLESNLVMYEFTKDKKYLDDFVAISHEVINNRDDYRKAYAQKPYWTTNSRNCPGPITYQTALIIAPMAHYIYFSKKEFPSSFNDLLTTPFTTFNSHYIKTYHEYAIWLYTEIKKTLDYYNTYYWISGKGYRQYADDPCYKKSKDVDAMDRNCNWGVVNTYLAAAFQGASEGALYLAHAQVAASQLKNCMQEKIHTNGAKYYQWKYTGWQKNKEPLEKRIDDISHAGAVIDFAFVCHKFRTLIKNTARKGCCFDGYFTDEDMTKLANTFIYKVYAEPLKYHNAINGTCTFYKFPDCKENNMDFLLQYGIGRWLQLANANDPFRPSSLNLTFSIVSDFFSQFIEKPTLTFSKQDLQTHFPFRTNGGSAGNTILGIALAAKNQGVFKFLGRNSTQNLDWYDNWQILPNNASHTQAEKSVDYSNIGFRIMPADSVIHQNCNYFPEEETVEHLIKDMPEMKLVAFGDFNGDGINDFVLHNVNNGGIFIYNVVNDALQLKAVEYFPLNQQLKFFQKCNIPDFEKDLLMIFRNHDAHFFLYELDF
jgi:hypothetical protein